MIAVAGVAVVAAAGCRPWSVRSGQHAAAQVGPAPHVAVLMINGGRTAAENYQSHLLHVRQFADILQAAGVTPDQVAIFSADGADPAPDLAVREEQPQAGFWRLGGTRPGTLLRPRTTFVNSVVPGFTLQPATKDGIARWLQQAATRLRPGDTLLLYVTDHGSRNAADPADNRIVLWGPEESMSVRELQALLEDFDPHVRVVALMSQCYSGGFANLMVTPARGTGSAADEPSGSVCGYFSSTPERPAYGCYPENRGRENVGHSFQFLQALAVTGNFAAAHVEALATDDTPDVPLRTSDVYLHALLERVAAARGESLAAVVDPLLRDAWENPAGVEPGIGLLDRIGRRFGCSSPHSLPGLDAEAQELSDIRDQLQVVSHAWRAALDDGNVANLDRFLSANAAWTARLNNGAVSGLDAPQRRALAAELLDALGAFTARDAPVASRLQQLHDRGTAAAAALYRMEVRLAVVLRLRLLLTTIAGREYLRTGATPSQRAAYEALTRCEMMALPSPPRAAAALPLRAPFPPLDDDVRALRAALPAWLGIQFRDVSEPIRQELGLPAGATTVQAVYPGSPAATAGLQAGDVLVGAAGQPFTERNQVRAWAMLSKAGVPAMLEVRRGERQLRLGLVPEPYPLKRPQLPAPQ